MSDVRVNLRILRRKWGLSQEELASLIPKGSRKRVSRIEQGDVPPNAGEIVAYRLIFGLRAREMFPRFYAEAEDAVMRRAYRLHKRVEHSKSAVASLKRELAERMLARATGASNRTHA